MKLPIVLKFETTSAFDGADEYLNGMHDAVPGEMFPSADRFNLTIRVSSGNDRLRRIVESKYRENVKE